MAITNKHKKARVFRDFLISKNTINMFKEDEIDTAVLFRGAYKINEENKQFMIIINDSIYITMQALLIRDVPDDKRDAMLTVINQLQFEYPTVKYVLTPDNHLMTSITFHGTDTTMDPSTILMCTVEYFKVLNDTHYKRFLDVL
ncbi:MAG: hypothetical protein ATN33_04850 [Epulopiscium sp. Nele67-Bin001]|nr:MAG: hypothetical protein BEN18_06445 [Epulopiscium sp. Nuni2H_MBin001]OON94136.1 MAG: hypothetical protein ATN33_04850 [Epulopiscium sp. Nele67-Bin001]